MKAAPPSQGKSDLPPWTPHDGPQRQFIESTAEEVLFGGAAGGGKTLALAALPLPWLKHPHLRALFLRRKTPQLEDLLTKARWIYKTGVDGVFAPAYPAAEFRGDKGIWSFPSGAQARFGHCDDKQDWLNYQGHEYQIIGFDELTHFTEEQYLEIKSRLRSGLDGLPRQIRATTNPGGPGHGWVFARWGPWIDPECDLPDWEIDGARGRGLPRRFDPATGKRLPPAQPGQILYVVKIGGADRFSVDPFEIDGIPAPTRTFIPARLSDNPTLLRNDPGYRLKLRDNGPVRQRQLEDGDWLVRPGGGLYFRREWVTFVDRSAVPANVRRARGWDKAATEPTQENKDPDWTRGVRVALASDGTIYIEDMVGVRAGPGSVTSLLKATAQLDGRSVVQRIPQDPGAAGKSQAAADVRDLAGFHVATKPVSGDKVTRFGPFSSQASPQSTGGEKGRVCIVKGPWNEELVHELESFPDGNHDDIADALADAYDQVMHPVAAAPYRSAILPPA